MALVVSILEPHVEAARAVADRVETAADLVEFRIDGMERIDSQALLAGRRKAVVVACPSVDEGGRYAGSVEGRLARLRAAAEAGASYVDLDWRVADRLTDLPGRCRRIVSMHLPGGMPADLPGAVRFLQSLAGPTDLIKLVPHSDRLEDALDLARLVQQGGGRMIAFATGRAAMVSRLLATAAGSPLIYAAPQAGSETAPGQPTLAELRAVLPPRAGSGTTAVFAVVGKPVGHSLSPATHSIALRMLQIDAMFLAFEPDDFTQFLDKVTPLNCIRGLAVTAPFKEDALRRSDRADETAKGIVAANTLIRTEQGWRAANTDDDGAADAIELGLEGKLLGRRVLVLGSGGAARAVAAGVRRRGAQLILASRKRAAAEKLAQHFGGTAVDWSAVGEVDYDVLVNATPVGQWPNATESPVPESAVRPGALIIDAVVRPPETGLARMAKARGAKFVPGVQWFLFQAIRQFRLFTGQEPPIGAMRATAIDALKREPKLLPGLIAPAVL